MHEPALTDSASRSFCTFRADRRLYGIDVSSLREISTNIAITPVPPAPPPVRGLANLRSRILLILDLRPLLGLAPAECTSDSRLIILKPKVAEDIGLLVDRGGDILSVRQDQIETVESGWPSPDASSGDWALPLVVGICKLERELMMIIDASRLTAIVTTLLQ
jgi:purine-binding chemotaxis protein CheW